MGIEFIRDEVDKRNGTNVDGVKAEPGKHRRWVRTTGHQAETHLERMAKLGYQPVHGEQARITSELLQRRRGRPKQVDTTIRDGNRVLMECPIEMYEARRKAQQDLTSRRTKGVMGPLTDQGGFDHTTSRTTNREE